MKEYRLKFPCHSINEAENIRERAHEKLWQELSAKEVIKSLTTSVLFDPLNFVCIVKVEVF